MRRICGALCTVYSWLLNSDENAHINKHIFLPPVGWSLVLYVNYAEYIVHIIEGRRQTTFIHFQVWCGVKVATATIAHTHTHISTSPHLHSSTSRLENYQLLSPRQLFVSLVCICNWHITFKWVYSCDGIIVAKHRYPRTCTRVQQRNTLSSG